MIKTLDLEAHYGICRWVTVGYGGLVARLVFKKNDEDDSYTITVPTCWQLTVRQGLFLIDTVHPVFLVWDCFTLVSTPTPSLKNSPTWFSACPPFYPLSFLTYCMYVLTYLLPSFLCSVLLLEAESVRVTFFPLCSVLHHGTKTISFYALDWVLTNNAIILISNNALWFI